MAQMEESNIQTEFLRAFIAECLRQLAIKKGPFLLIDYKNQLEEKPKIEEIVKKQILQESNIKPLPVQVQNPQIQNKQKSQIPIQMKPAPVQIQRTFQRPPQQIARPMTRQLQSQSINQKNPQQQTQFQRTMTRPQIQPAPPIAAPQILGMEKINSFLSDPSVLSIECPGPDRPVLINKSGSMQTSSTILTSDEINKLMGEVSKTTKIPLISGIFKAAFGRYVITAVVSDFVGTRFVIQKKSPFMPQQ